MPIQSTIAREIHRGAVQAAAAAAGRFGVNASPAITEVAQINAALAYVAEQLHDVPEGIVRSGVLIALAECCGVEREPEGCGSALVTSAAQCSAIVRGTDGKYRCSLRAGHHEAHDYLEKVES